MKKCGREGGSNDMVGKALLSCVFPCYSKVGVVKGAPNGTEGNGFSNNIVG